jgi:hypothetical protein
MLMVEPIRCPNRKQHIVLGGGEAPIIVAQVPGVLRKIFRDETFELELLRCRQHVKNFTGQATLFVISLGLRIFSAFPEAYGQREYTAET